MEQRLDIYLVDHLSIKSRSKAQELIRGGYVTVNGKKASKTGLFVSEKDDIKIIENDVLKYVSRGGLKLEKAINEFGLDLSGVSVLDIGSSTGGFTDCALKHGAKKVVAVDVGTDIMDAGLRTEPRVELHENTDIRDFDIDEAGYSDISLCVCDASFISLPIALSKLGLSNKEFKLVTLIKPQFECGQKTAAKYKGVITDRQVHKDVLTRVLNDLKGLGFSLQKLTYSPITGGDGNIEYLALFSHGNDAGSALTISEAGIEGLIDEAFKAIIER
ncbi:MAG: TlyA family RNA methyltransferase [Lachnospiraceae bacterium]|nr:TlyA family RNA methyltransferase [Lachnospiraceae bacterium]